MTLTSQPNSPSMDRWFGISLMTMLLFVAGLTWWRWDAILIASAIASLGILQAVIYYGLPNTRQKITKLFFGLTWPLSVFASVFLLATLYYLILSPIGIILRMLGRDPLAKRISGKAETYWVNCAETKTTESYFRQY